MKSSLERAKREVAVLAIATYVRTEGQKSCLVGVIHAVHGPDHALEGGVLIAHPAAEIDVARSKKGHIATKVAKAVVVYGTGGDDAIIAQPLSCVVMKKPIVGLRVFVARNDAPIARRIEHLIEQSVIVRAIHFPTVYAHVEGAVHEALPPGHCLGIPIIDEAALALPPVDDARLPLLPRKDALHEIAVGGSLVIQGLHIGIDDACHPHEHANILGVEIVDHALRIGKESGVPLKGVVACFPRAVYDDGTHGHVMGQIIIHQGNSTLLRTLVLPYPMAEHPCGPRKTEGVGHAGICLHIAQLLGAQGGH
jgi:hypothetical protein